MVAKDMETATCIEVNISIDAWNFCVPSIRWKFSSLYMETLPWQTMIQWAFLQWCQKPIRSASALPLDEQISSQIYSLCKHQTNVCATGLELKWFENYPYDRRQFFNINGVSSYLLGVLLGVPLYSMYLLGPLLFFIYINDLPQCYKLCSFLFADDTTLLVTN